MPQTIQYRPAAFDSSGKMKSGGDSVHYSATYTAYPSYQSETPLQFRTIQQVSYPVTPEISPEWTTPEQTAKYWNDNQVVIQHPAWMKQSSKNAESEKNTQSERNTDDVTSTQVPNPQQNDFDSASATEFRTTIETESLVFVKSQMKGLTEEEKPSPLFFSRNVNQVGSEETFSTSAEDYLCGDDVSPEMGWWLNTGDIYTAYTARQVAYNQLAPPTSTGGTLQTAPIAPAYACGLFPYGNNSANNGGTPFQSMGYGYSPQQQGYYASIIPQQVQSPQVIQDAWNTYLNAYHSRQYGIAQVANVPPTMPQMGQFGQMGMSRYYPNYAAGSMMPQTLGYIVVYPKSASEEEMKSGENAAENGAQTDVPQTGQMQAMFVPFDSPQGMGIQASLNHSGGLQQGMPGMMGGMGNPYMMNPWMAGMNHPYMMMNPYMNPMMMGMGQPQIIIQMPSEQGRQRRGLGGLFARRQNRQNENIPTVSYSNSGVSAAYRIPAKAAYPYGYFGASPEPFQTGSFGGYHNTQFNRVIYPGY
ncbi:MAG: hypothetical protein LBQ54_07435 [Planctomycetaceae bacterium]|nr:hypothetical protein [Planctomycetaceae bacterium]